MSNSDDDATEPLTDSLTDILEDEDDIEDEEEKEKQRKEEQEKKEEEEKKERRRRNRAGSKTKRSSKLLAATAHLDLEDEDEGFDLDAICANLEKIGAGQSDSALDDILLDECQKLSEEAVFTQVEEFGRILGDITMQKMELEAMEHQLDEDHKNLEEKLGVDAKQLMGISTRIAEFKEEALRAKADRLSEFKLKKKNLHAQKKLAQEVYTIKSKYEEKNWEQVELEDAQKALEKEISIMKEILVELQKAKTFTSDIQEKIPSVKVSVHAKVKEMFEVEEFKDKFVLQLLDCQALLRTHSLSRIDTMKLVEHRVTSLQKKSMLVVQQHDFGTQILECLADVQVLRQLEADITDMRLQFAVLLQVEVDALHHLLARVQQDRKRFHEQILEENKEKKILFEKLKKLNHDFQQVLDKAKGNKKSHKLVTELVEMLQPFQIDLASVITDLSRMMYEDMIITSHRDRLDMAKKEIKSVSDGMKDANTHHAALLDELEGAMLKLHEMREKKREMEETLEKETELLGALQKQVDKKGKGKKKK